jgi:hypothetical protein
MARGRTSTASNLVDPLVPLAEDIRSDAVSTPDGHGRRCTACSPSALAPTGQPVPTWGSRERVAAVRADGHRELPSALESDEAGPHRLRGDPNEEQVTGDGPFWSRHRSCACWRRRARTALARAGTHHNQDRRCRENLHRIIPLAKNHATTARRCDVTKPP